METQLPSAERGTAVPSFRLLWPNCRPSQQPLSLDINTTSAEGSALTIVMYLSFLNHSLFIFGSGNVQLHAQDAQKAFGGWDPRGPAEGADISQGRHIPQIAMHCTSKGIFDIIVMTA